MPRAKCRNNLPKHLATPSIGCLLDSKQTQHYRASGRCSSDPPDALNSASGQYMSAVVSYSMVSPLEMWVSLKVFILALGTKVITVGVGEKGGSWQKCVANGFTSSR